MYVGMFLESFYQGNMTCIGPQKMWNIEVSHLLSDNYHEKMELPKCNFLGMRRLTLLNSELLVIPSMIVTEMLKEGW